MKDVLVSIRNLLRDGVFTDEQHVRFSLVGRICQSLGWDIWNPAEFFTEYKVEKVPTQVLPKDSNGRVDVALFLSDNKPKAAEVFMEIKAPGKLMVSLKDCEDQLHAYTGHHRIAIGILTDGVIWRFYVPAIGGYFKDTLFGQIDIENDDIDYLSFFFTEILHRDNFRKKALDKAELLFEELVAIERVQKVKQKAIDIARETGLTEYHIAQRLLKQNENIEMDTDEIQRLWNRSVPSRGVQTINDLTEKQKPPRQKFFTVPSDEYVNVFISARSVKASGRYNIQTNEFTLFQGSEVVKTHYSSFNGSYLEAKKRMINSDILRLDPSGTKYILTRDSEFKAPSAASRLVLGRSSNGFDDWLDAQGRKLSLYRR